MYLRSTSGSVFGVRHQATRDYTTYQGSTSEYISRVSSGVTRGCTLYLGSTYQGYISSCYKMTTQCVQDLQQDV